MGGIYDLLRAYELQNDPRFVYEGLYQDPRRDDTTYYNGDLKPAYGLMDNVKSLQAFKSSAFPQGIDAFRPRIGKTQPDFINAPQDDYASLYSTQPNFINAPQDDYASLYSLPKLDTSRFTGVDLESGYLDRAGSYGQDVYAEQEKQKSGGIGGLFRFLLGLAVPGAGLLMNLGQSGFDKLRGGFDKGLGALRNINQRIQGSDFGQATSIADYLDMRKYGGLQGRRNAAAATMAQARGLQKQIDQRPTATQTNQDRGRGDRPGGANYSAPSRPSRTSPQSGMQAERTRSRDLGSMRGAVGR